MSQTSSISGLNREVEPLVPEPRSVRVPDGVRTLPRVVIPDTRVVSGERMRDSGTHPVQSPRWKLVWGGLLLLALLVGWARMLDAPAAESERSPSAASAMDRCGGSALQSQMCKAALQGNLVSGLY